MTLASDDAFNTIERAVNAAESKAERGAIVAAFIEQALGFYARLFGHEAAAARAAELSRRHHEKTVRLQPGARRRT